MSSTMLLEWLSKLGLGKELSSVDILSGLAVNTAISKIVKDYTVRLSVNNTPSARINNWNTVISELDKVGIHVGQQEKSKILNGDEKAVYAILQQIKHYYDKHKQEADMDLSKIDARGDPKTARSLLELFILVIIKYYGFSVKEAVALLSNDSKYLAHILAKGFKEKSQPVEQMISELIQLLPQITTFCKVKENEIFFLKSIKPGLISKFLSISELTLELLTAFTKGIAERYDILKNELMSTLILCLRRHSCMLGPIIASIIEMVGHNRNLLTLFVSHAGAGQVELLMIEMINQYEREGKTNQIFELFRIYEYTLSCIENLKNSDHFVNAATFLIKIIEHNYYNFIADIEILSKLVDALSSLTISKRGDVICYTNLLFALLQQFGRKKNAVAPQLLNIAVDRYLNTINEDESQNYLHNFLEIVEYFPSIPTAAITEAILARYENSTTTIRQLQFDFLMGSIDNVNQKIALRIFSNVTKIFVEEIGCVDSVSKIVQAIIRKFDTKSIFDSAVKFIKVCLSVHYSNLRKLSYSKSLIEGVVKVDKSNVFFKVKNMEVEKLLSNVLAINNEKLNKALEPLICYSFIQSEIKNKEESQGIKKAMLMLGTEEQLRNIYENDAKLMLEDAKEFRKKSGSKEKNERVKEKQQPKMRVNSDASLLSRKRDLLTTLNPPKIALDAKKGLEKYTKNFLEKVGKLSLEEEKRSQEEERKEELRKKMALRMVEQGINISMGKEVAVSCLYQFNSRDKQQNNSDYSYLPFYDEQVEDERDVKGLQYLFKRYNKLFKLYYTNYARPRPNNIKLFQEFSERGNLMQSADAWKLLRDHELDEYINVNQVQYLVQRINSHFKKENRDSSLLDYQVFENFIIQAALTMFSRPPRDMRSRPISEMVQQIINRFKMHAQKHRIDEKMFEENDHLQSAKPEELKDLNEKLKENPDYILPEGYKKQTNKKLAFEYKVHLHSFDSSYADVCEVLDQILNEQLGFHILEPYSVTTVQAVAKPILYQTLVDSTMRERSLSSVFPRQSRFLKLGADLEGEKGAQSNAYLSRVENKFSKEKKLKEEEKQMRQAEEIKRRQERDRQVKAMLEKHRERQQEIDRKKEEQRIEQQKRAEEERKRKEKYQQDLKRKVSEYAEKKRIDKTKEEQEAKRKKDEEAKIMEKMKLEFERKRKMIEQAKQKKRDEENVRIQKEAADIKRREEENKLKLMERKEKTIKMLEDYRYRKQKEREESEEKLKNSRQSQILVKPSPSETPSKRKISSRERPSSKKLSSAKRTPSIKRTPSAKLAPTAKQTAISTMQIEQSLPLQQSPL